MVPLSDTTLNCHPVPYLSGHYQAALGTDFSPNLQKHILINSRSKLFLWKDVSSLLQDHRIKGQKNQEF